MLFFILSVFCVFLSSRQSCKNVGHTELEIETHVAQIMGRAHTKAPDCSLIEPSEPGEEDKTYLLFTTGSLTYSPHQIGKIALKLQI